MAGMMNDPKMAAILNMVGNQYMPYPEYSSSQGGYLPVDSGTMGANLNQLQDVASLSGQGLAGNPLMLAALGLISGDQFGSTQVEVSPASTDGYDMLARIARGAEATGFQTPESVLAMNILQGMSPSQAVEETKKWWTDKDPDTGMSGADEWQSLYNTAPDVTTLEAELVPLAASYFDSYMRDKPAVYEEQPNAGLQALRDLGIPDPGTEWTPQDLVTGYDESQQAFIDADERASQRRQVAESKFVPQQDNLQYGSVAAREGMSPQAKASMNIVNVSGTPDQLR